MDLSPQLTQPLASFGPVVPAGGAALRGFPVERQLLSNWCWAASTVALCQYFGHPGPFSQQQFAATALNKPICAIARPNPFCNDLFDLGTALGSVGHLKQPVIPSPLTDTDLFAALQLAPVACQMQLPSLGGHAVVVVDGRTDVSGQLFVRVADPMDGTIVVQPFAQFRNNFRGGGGFWIRTYLTH
jgi:Papain-like cysteine protease AvrRpt2